MLDRIGAWLFLNSVNAVSVVIAFVMLRLGIVSTRILMAIITLGLPSYGLQALVRPGHPEDAGLAILFMFGGAIVTIGLQCIGFMAENRNERLEQDRMERISE